MATVNLSDKFENNLRRVSGAGVATLCAEVGDSGDRLGQGIVYADELDDFIVYCIPKDSIVPKIYFIVDEAFDAGITCHISSIVDDTSLVAALDLATEGKTVSAVVDSYFDAVDGIKFELSDAVTKGKVRVVVEYIACDTNEGIFTDVGA